jgi:predicted ATPase/class 3 adenylate cyclase/Tfp pilus assembly protein PilF
MIGLRRTSMSAPPTGTVTFLFSDIEGSTRLWEEHPEAMRVALARHDALIRGAIEQHNGHVFKTIGDAFCAAFHTAPDALNAALAAQQALTSEIWPEPIDIKVRMALYTGAVEHRDNDYFGQPLNRVARLLGAGHGGQVLLSQTTCDLACDLLPSAVSLKAMGEHRLRGLNQPESIFQLLHPDLPANFPALKSLGGFPNNLPLQLTSFIGREKESAEVKSLLQKTRLLTLTGSGGCGKTRLAMQVAADMLEHYSDGVWVVELASLTDTALVPQTVASALGLREQVGKTFVQTLTDYLKSKRLLLVLDNCEHLLNACAQLCDALQRACSHLTILTSSREGLGISGELTYRVPSLSLPDPKQTITIEAINQYEAVRLFVERAQFQKSDFRVTSQNALALASVCHRLDGIPLAIELAAARVRSLSVEEIHSRLDNSFRILIGGSKTALPRQQTLRALIDWSYDLLTDTERLLLCRLSVFAGGWTLAAAEQVGVGESADRGTIEDWEVLDLLTSLVDKSLVIAQTQAETARYHLLETVRQYARDRWREREDVLLVRARHRDYFLALAEAARPKLGGLEQARWLGMLEEEHDNLRQALTFCLEQPKEAEAGMRLAAALSHFWGTRGHQSEGRQHLNAVLAFPVRQGDLKARADALNGAGLLAQEQGDYAAARALHEESLTIERELGDKQGIAISLNNLGILADCQGDYVAARALYEESLTIKRELEDKQGIAISLNNLGILAYDQGDYVAARVQFEESLTIKRELGDKAGIATSLMNLGNAAYNLGDNVGARALYEESLTLYRKLEHKRGIAYCLDASASLNSQDQQERLAARLWGAATALREEIGVPRLSQDQERVDRKMAEVQSALGEAAFTAAWKEGRAMTWEQAVALALGEA